jgi:hypothetical protein
MPAVPQPSFGRILRRDPLGLLAAIGLAADLVICRWRPLTETLITVGVCAALVVWRTLTWRAFFARAVRVAGAITGVRHQPLVVLGLGLAGRVRAVVTYSYSFDDKGFQGSFDDRPARWPATTPPGAPVELCVDGAHPEHAEPWPLWDPAP